MSEKRTGRPCGFRAARPDNTDHHHSDQSGRHSPRKNPAQGLNHAANAGRHALADRGHDLYETPPEAVLALLSAERLPQIIWEPACGPGAIVGVPARCWPHGDRHRLAGLWLPQCTIAH